MARPSNFPDVPGMYVVLSLRWRNLFMVELTQDNKVFQCKPDWPFNQDGELDDDGWNEGEEGKLLFVGPFQRG